MDYYYYDDYEEEIGNYGEELQSDQAAWDWGYNNEQDVDPVLDVAIVDNKSSSEAFIEQTSYIMSKCVHEDDFEGMIEAENERRFAAFINYASFLNDMVQEDPIINTYFAGDQSCAW